MAKGPKNVHAAKMRAEAREQLKPSDWFVEDQGADHVARRRQVWGLLHWYHIRVVQPHLGLRGFLRRLWNRIRGRAWDNLSPFEQLEQKIAEAMQAAEEEQLAELEHRHRN